MTVKKKSTMARIKRLERAERALDAKIQKKAAASGARKSTTRELRSKVFGDPAYRRGEDSMSSRGFSFLRMAGALQSKSNNLGSQWDNAKVEHDVATQFHKAFKEGGGSSIGFDNDAVLAPFGTEFLPEQMQNDSGFGARIKSLVHAGVADADPDEVNYLAKKHYIAPGRKDMSWLDSVTGGSLVGPADRGELIDLFRNKDALMRAGAQTIGLGPNGRVSYPRQTSASTAYYQGENQASTGTSIGTGSLNLSAKKVTALIKLPNELIRFANPSAEALCRLDMTRSITLTMDKQLLEGPGSDLKPTGLVNLTGAGVVSFNAGTTATDGDTFLEEDIYTFMSTIEENNAEFEGFILRPSMYWALLKRRNAAVTANDKKGAFTFSPFRQIGDSMGTRNLNGFPATTTAQVSNARTKGSGTNLTYIIGGMWSDYLIAMFGAIEFAATTTGDTAFANDQTWLRAILIHDGGPRHPGAFAFCDNLLVV